MTQATSSVADTRGWRLASPALVPSRPQARTTCQRSSHRSTAGIGGQRLPLPTPQPRSGCVSAVCIHVVTITPPIDGRSGVPQRRCQDQDSLPRIQTAENVFLTISRDSLRCMSASIDQNEALNAALLLNMVI